MEKVKKMIKVLCLRATCDERFLYEKGQIYDLPEDHPCLQYFEPVKEVSDPAQLGPAGTILVEKKGAADG